MKNKYFYVKINHGDIMQEVIKKIYDYSLEEIMGERFGRYAKSIIQERALPDVRDGLKPVQRRILYGMYKDGNTYDKPYRKSAKTVGYIMGNYHPHGDSSIYDAMVRMSQWWKQSTPYVDMQGNNGSMDGDSAAAMRYTEARLAKISNEFLKDIKKETVAWAPNFDDTEMEPTVLPCKFPNLLVNGSTGISAGYATNIPTHNLVEVCDATIKRIDSPNCRLDTIMDIIKGPDFPTGGIAEGIKGIKDAFETGRGRIIVRAKVEFVKSKGKEQIIIHEIPFEVNKALLVKKIDEIRIDKKIDGIAEVRDESDRENTVQITIDLKKGANKDLILNYLYKNTDLQISYNYNMVAIVNQRPVTLGVLQILDAYIVHLKNVIIKRTEFDLNYAKARMHIVEGLIKALSILDQVIKTIRASKNRSDAILNLIEEYEFTKKQAEAIVVLQLYKLTNTDVTELLEEKEKLQKIIDNLTEILSNEDILKTVMKSELKMIKKEYGHERRTEIKEEVTDIKIDIAEMLPKEDVVAVVTRDGYVKRVSKRSFAAASNDETGLKENDYVIGMYEINTLDTILLFTDKGNYLYVPVHEIPELKWKDLGKHISNIIKISSDENIIAAYPVYNFDEELYVTMFTKNGMIKRTKLSDFNVSRHSKPIVSMKLKGDDRVVNVIMSNYKEIFIVTKNGYGLWYDADEVPVTGLRTSGVKSISLKNDEVVSGNVFNGTSEYLTILTENRTIKRVKLSEFDKTTRARRGVSVIRLVKTNPYYIMKSFVISNKDEIGLKTKDEILTVKATEAPISQRLSTGSTISKTDILDAFVVSGLITPDTKEDDVVKVNADNISLKEVDERILTIDDFLDNIENNK